MSENRSRAELSEHEDVQLDRVFGALSDPVRRSILQRLQRGPLLVSELAAPFAISLQAVSRHIQVLEQAGLVQKERTGRISRCSVTLGPIVSAAVWINGYTQYWQEQFDLLATTLRELDPPPRNGSPTSTGARAPRQGRVPAATPRRDARRDRVKKRGKHA